MISTNATLKSRVVQRPSASQLARTRSGMPMRARTPETRTFEVVSLQADGSLHLSSLQAPAVALFENAFTAFARGTVIQSADGQIAIEDVQPGDMLHTSAGETAKVMWIGSTSIVPAQSQRRMPLVRIMADCFGENRPSSFLTVGAAARILQTPHHMLADAEGQAMFTPARSFVDGENVIEVCPPTPVRMFHICLSRHAAINVGGLQMETYHPDDALRGVSPAMRDQFMSLFPHIKHASEFGPLAHPRASETDLSQND